MTEEKTPTPTLESLCQQFDLKDIKTYEKKEELKTIKVIWIDNVDLATEKLSEIVEKLKPKVIKYERERSYDEGGYAKIRFNLAPQIDITGTVYFANLLGDFGKTLLQNGYTQENYIDVSWGICDWVRTEG